MMEENKKYIDYNIDLAQISQDNDTDKAFELLDKVSSVNVACGFHSGTPLAIKKAIAHCKHKEKVIGAHISLPNNIENPLELTEQEIEAIVLYQLGALAAFAKAESLNVEYVRPHGTMYKLMSQNSDFSLSVAKSIKKFSEWLVLYGASGEIIKNTARELDINIAQEVNLTTQYKTGGTVDFDTPCIMETGKSLIRLRRLYNLSEIETDNGVFEKIEFDTVHFSINSTNIFELLNDATEIFIPRPVNYNNVVESGWV